MKFTPFSAAWDQGWARPAPKYVQGHWYCYADLSGHTVSGPHRIMTEGDYAYERMAKLKRDRRLLSVVDEESVARAQAKYEEQRVIRMEREHQIRWEREHAYERRVEQDKELERQRQRRLAQMEMGKQQTLRAAEVHEKANKMRLQAIVLNDFERFEKWLIRKGIITADEAVTSIENGTITTQPKGASE